MKSVKIINSKPFSSTIAVSPDKSISHRAAILLSMAEGSAKISNFLTAEDTLNTLKMLQSLGVKIERRNKEVYIEGVGLNGFRPPENVIDLGNSGTSMRISAGFLSSQNFMTILTGDASLRKRPMGRIIKPLSLMGARILSNNQRPPLVIVGEALKGIFYDMPVASAQVKSAIMLAGLYADGVTEIVEPAPSRDHTERLFSYLNIPYMKKKNNIRIMSIDSFRAKNIEVCGDISSAAFFIIYSLIYYDSSLNIIGVNVNPTRTGILDILKRMGVAVEIKNVREVSGEPVADLHIESTDHFDGVTIQGADIPRVIDEIPILAVLMAFAETKSIVKDAQELRVKESDRIKSTINMLKTFNVEVEEKDDGFIVYPSKNKLQLQSPKFNSFGDHRIAMSATVFAAALKYDLIIEDIDCISTSFPDFFELLKELNVEFEIYEMA